MDTVKMNELAITDRVFAGYLTGIPAKKSNEVRIFLSATSTDWHAERTWIMKHGVPRLRSFCKEKGLDFQVVDLRWGVKETLIDDHTYQELSLHEIRNCQTISVGPNYVALLGDKYGLRPLVPEIEASEFKLLRNTAIECGYDISLLTTWYLCDYNREPTTYVLQPITSLFPSFFDSNPMNGLLQQQAQREWYLVVEKLHQLFRTVAEVLYKTEKISEATRRKYLKSAVEAEVTAGILQSEHIKTGTLCFQRTLNGISLAGGIPSAEQFTDVVEKALDPEAEELREQLRLEKIRSAMTKDNLFRYNLVWDKQGLNASENPLHKSYLEQFGNDFLASTKSLISNGVEKAAGLYGSTPLLNEVLHHLHLCKSECETFCGREDVLVEIRSKLRAVEYQKHVQDESSGDKVHRAVSSQVKIVQIKNADGDQKEIANGFQTMNQNGLLEDDSERQRSNEAVNIIPNDNSCIAGSTASESNVKSSHSNDSDEVDEDTVQNINSKLDIISEADEYTTPLIIHGPSGSGKTAIAAKVMELSKSWFPDCVSIIRFLGTSHVTSSIRDVLVGLCLQISHSYDIPGPVGVDLNTSFQFLVNYLKTLLWRIDSATRSLVLILDSVDQLTPADHAHTFNWLPVKLPPNVHLLVSVVSDRLDYLKQAMNVFPECDRYIEIIELEKATSLEMVVTLCGKAGCHLAKRQTNALLDKFEQCKLALYQKLLIDRAMEWRSYDKTEEQNMGPNVSAVINRLFDRLELDHSSVLVKHGLAFICASRDGLTDFEIEDLLSLDDEVLQDAYLYHLPPDPEAIRIPQLPWKRVLYDIRKYLVNRRHGGQKVIAWFHRQFAETATSRYIGTRNEKTVHQLMTEYFQGVWSSTPKVLRLTKGRKGIYPNAYRQVPAQPLMYSEGVHNTRMLHCLPFHLVHCGKFDALTTELFLDPEWLYAKCLTLSLTSLMDDFRVAETGIAKHIQTLRVAMAKADSIKAVPKQREEMAAIKTELDGALEKFEATKLITKAVLLSSEQIRRDPANLPLHMIAQFGPRFKGIAFVEKLVARCVDWCKRCPSPLLLPLTECLVKPGSNLLYTIEVDLTLPGGWRLEDHSYRGVFLQEATNKLFVVQQQADHTDQICVFDIVENGSCIRVVDVHKHVRSLRWTGNNKYLQLEEYTKPGEFECRSYLYKSLSSPVVQFPRPHGVMAVSATGKYVAFSSGCKVYVCLAKQDMPVYYEIEDLSKEVTDIHISPDDSYILATQKEPDIVPENPPTFEGHKRSLIFDLNAKKLLHTIDARLNLTNNTLITRNNILICTGSMDKGSVYCYDIVVGALLREVKVNDTLDLDLLQLHASHQYVLCWYRGNITEDNDLDSGAHSKVAKLLRISDGTLCGTCPTSGDYGGVTVFGATFVYYAVCSRGDNALNIYYAGHVNSPLKNGVLIHRLSGHKGPILEVLVPSNQNVIITAGMDNTIKVWDLQLILSNFHTELTAIEKRLSALSRLKPTPEQAISQFTYIDTAKRYETTQLCLNTFGDSLYVGTNQGQLLRCCTETGLLKVSQEIGTGPVNIMLLSQSGQFVIAIGPAKVHVEDLQSDNQLSLEPPGSVDCAVEANNVLVCGSAGPESKARVWNILTGQMLREINRTHSFAHMAINRIGTKIVTSSQGRPIVVPLKGCQPSEPDPRFSVDKMAGAKVTCCDINVDDSMAVMGTDTGYVYVLNMQGKYVNRMKQQSEVVTLTFSPDGKALLTSGLKSIYVWSCVTGALRYKLTRHQGTVTHLKFDPSGRFFLSFANDKQIILWDFRRCASIVTFHTQSKISGLDVSTHADMVVYIPEGAIDVAILKPNVALCGLIEGNYKPVSLEPKAQALAFAFSSHGRATSGVCSMM